MPEKIPDVNPALLKSKWPAAWCRCPKGPHLNSAVYLFRRSLFLESVPQRFVVHVTADQRYQLFVNGRRVCWGPARGDLEHWRFETVDLAPCLEAGENVLGAVVHYLDISLAPLAQITAEAAFLMQGDTEAEAGVNTPGEWKVYRDPGYAFSLEPMKALYSYFSIGPAEMADGRLHPWGWEKVGFDDSQWLTPERVNRDYAAPYGLEDGESSWWLVPRPIPLMQETVEEFGGVVRANVPSEFPLSLPAQTEAVILFDHGFETCAFPEIQVSGGAGARVRLSYAESLLPEDARPWELHRKGNRDETEGRRLFGYHDSWVLDGGTDRVLRPLWWKTFRFAELHIVTGDDPVTVQGVRAMATGYPFEERATFRAPELPDADRIWEVGWRTIRRCAHETYVDCPYYEQLQYVGDTRIQALVTQYVSGDHRLFRNALSHYNESRLPDGLTHSRYPCRTYQVITGFSLWWIGMTQDYAMLVPGQEEFLRSLLPGIRGVLGWFRERVDRSTGMLGPLEWWCFGDWCDAWRFGAPPGAKEGGSSFMSLQYALALRDAAVVWSVLAEAESDAFRKERLAMERDDLLKESKSVADAVNRLCFDVQGARVADTPERHTFSQHASTLATLSDAVPPDRQQAVMERALSDPDLTQATFYFRFYLNRALVKAGLGDRYLDTLQPWRDMLAMGLTTWAEKPEPTRSDCHAWSASPNYEFLATVLGIQPGTPGFATVLLAPHLGNLTELSGGIPHPQGEIAVAYRRNAEVLFAEVTLPENVAGELRWRGKAVELHGGFQQVAL